MGIAEKFIKQGQLEQEEYPELLNLYKDPETVGVIRQEAVRIQKKYFGNKIYTRGLIEFTNYCRNDCYYCGIRHSNTNADRYRLPRKKSCSAARMDMSWDFGHLYSREGKTPWFNDDRMIDIIKSIKQELSGLCYHFVHWGKIERKLSKFRDAGADRYFFVMRQPVRNIIVIFIRRI